MQFCISKHNENSWAVFWCSGRRVGDYDYFDEIKKIISDEDNVPLAQEAANNFLTFLLNYKIPIHVYRDIPVTDKYKEIAKISVQQEKQFIDLLISGEYQISVPMINFQTYIKDNKEYYLVRKLQLYEFYVDYCKKYRVYVLAKEIFWQRMKGMIEEYRYRRDGANIWYYLVPLNWISLSESRSNLARSLLSVCSSSSQEHLSF